MPPEKTAPIKITKDMTVQEIVERFPMTMPVMMKYGIQCFGCHASTWETLEMGVKGHGMTDEQFAEMLKEMNECVKDYEE